MNASEFFQVLLDSNLHRALPWYYRSPFPYLVLLAAGVSWVFLLQWSYKGLAKGYADFPRDPEKRDFKERIRPFLRDANAHLEIARVLATTLAFLVPLSVCWLAQHPQWLLRTIHSKADSLYDLTPIGVQFVVSFLFWAAVFSVLEAFSLSIVVLAGLWLKHRGRTFIDELLYRWNRGKSLETPMPLPKWLLLLAAIALLLLLLLYALFFSTTANGERLRPITGEGARTEQNCADSEQVELLGESWEEVGEEKGAEASGRRLRGRLIVRFPVATHQSDIKLRIGGDDLPILNTTSSAAYDPLDVIVIPWLSADSTRLENKFAADTLRQILAQFELDGSEGHDAVWLILAKPSESNTSETNNTYFLWTNHAANVLYAYLVDVDRKENDGVDKLKRLTWDFQGSAYRSPRVGLANVRPVIMGFFWYPGEASLAPKDLGMYQAYREHLKALQDKYQVWLVELTEVQNNQSGDIINHLPIRLPSPLIDGNTGELQTEPIARQLEKTLKLQERIRGLRLTRAITFETSKVYASRDSGRMRLSVKSSCFYLPLEVTLNNGGRDNDGTGIETPVGAQLAWGMLWGVGMLYPTAMAFGAVYWYRTKASGQGSDQTVS